MDVKVCILGASQTGKSSLLKAIAGRPFDSGEPPTIGIDLIMLPQDGDVRLCLWDTAGQEQFRAIVRGYFRDAHILVHVFSTDLDSSLDHLRTDTLLIGHIRHVLVGNKTDLSASEHLLREATRFAKRHKMPLMLVSAKTGAGVSELHDHLLEIAADLAAGQNNIPAPPPAPPKISCCHQ